MSEKLWVLKQTKIITKEIYLMKEFKSARSYIDKDACCYEV